MSNFKPHQRLYVAALGILILAARQLKEALELDAEGSFPVNENFFDEVKAFDDALILIPATRNNFLDEVESTFPLLGIEWETQDDD